jgi:hypothetical protein
MITSQRDVRKAFWQLLNYDGKPRVFYGMSQNELPPNTRMAFVEFVDRLARDGQISERLAQRVTL